MTCRVSAVCGCSYREVPGEHNDVKHRIRYGVSGANSLDGVHLCGVDKLPMTKVISVTRIETVLRWKAL